MAGTIYTPVTLWEDFSLDLPMTATISKEYEKDGIVFRKTHFTGRRTSSGTVNIFALAAFDKNNTLMPAVLILPNYSKGVDEATVELFARRGYFAFMVDYGGNGKEGERTEYPEDISYAHYTGDEECIHRIETDAKETCWYEWCAVGRYALYYLSKHKRVSCTGGFGIKHGATGYVAAGGFRAVELRGYHVQLRLARIPRVLQVRRRRTRSERRNVPLSCGDRTGVLRAVRKLPVAYAHHHQ